MKKILVILFTLFAVFSLAAQDADFFLKRGVEYYEAGKFDLALEDFNRAVTLKPNDYIPYYARGSFYYEMDDLDLAISDFSKAISLNPNEVSLYLDRGTVYNEKGEYDRAIEDFTKVIAFLPNTPGSWILRGDVYFDKGELDRSIEDYSRAITLDSNNTVAWNNRGIAYLEKGELARAFDDFTKAISLDPNEDTAWNNRGEVYRIRGELDRSINDFTRAITLNPNNEAAWNNRGAAYKDKGEVDRAINDLNKAITLNPNLATAISNRGEIYRIRGELNRAIDDYTRAIALVANDAFIWNNRGLAYLDKGELDLAISDFTKAITLDPGLDEAWHNRGYTYGEKGENARMFADFRQAIVVADKSSNILNIFSRSWEYTGDIYESWPYLEGRTRSNDTEEFITLVRYALDRSIDKAEKVRSSLGFRGADLMAGQLYQYYAAVDLEASFGLAGSAFAYSEGLRSRGFLDQMGTDAALKLPGIAPGDVQKARNLIQEIDDLRELLSRLNPQMDVEIYALTGAALTRAETELAALDAQIASKVPRYAELRNPRTASLVEAQAFCGNDRAILEYVLWDSSVEFKPPATASGQSTYQERPSINSYCLVITRNGITPVRLDHNLDYSAKIKDLRDKLYYIRRNTIVTGQEEIFEAERNDLYNVLIKPVLPHIPNNIKNILIVPDGNLAFLPFDMLRESNRPEDQNLGERFSISLSPSVSCSIIARQYNIPMVEPIIAFGGVLYRPEDERRNAGAGSVSDSESRLAAFDKKLGDYRGSSGQGPLGREKAEDFYKRKPWSYLAWTVAEVQGLQRIATVAPRIIQGREASMHNVKQLSLGGTLLNYPIIHFACHGFFDDDLSPQAALVLSEVSGLLRNESLEDGYLSIEEIALLNLRARMVMLSACETGRGHIKRGDGMTGLARSFMVAGAQNVGVSLWEISDEATTEFMWSLYSKVIREKKSFRDAYSEVKEEFRKSEKWSHPYYWAGFTFYE